MALNPNFYAPITISVGAIPGAISRYYLTLLCHRWLGTGFPYGTFLINLTGAMAMGFLVTLFLRRSLLAAEWQLCLTTGFLGSYTTFSTYSLETLNLLRSGQVSLALLYGCGSLALGVLGAQIGQFLATLI
jgi:fluoride exporter